MPKTVPKSLNKDDLGVSCSASSSNGGTGGDGTVPKLKRSRRELEPNVEDDDEYSSSSGEPSRKQPNLRDSNQRVTTPAPPPTQDPPSPPPSPPSRSEFLLQALQRIQDLQDEIEFLENDPYAEDADTASEGSEEELVDASFVMGHQAEALGFAVCVRETMAFLEREGIPADSPMMVNLRSRLVGRCEQNMSC